MPVHDWTRVEAGIFHAFHVAWVPEIQKALNDGLLPEGYYALAEQHAGRAIADILTLHALWPIVTNSNFWNSLTLTEPSFLRRNGRRGTATARNGCSIRRWIGRGRARFWIVWSCRTGRRSASWR